MHDKIELIYDKYYGYLKKINNNINNIVINYNNENLITDIFVILMEKINNKFITYNHEIIKYENPIDYSNMYIYELHIDNTVTNIVFNNFDGNEIKLSALEKKIKQDLLNKTRNNINNIEEHKLSSILMDNKIKISIDNFILYESINNKLVLTNIKYVNYRILLFFEESKN